MCVARLQLPVNKRKRELCACIILFDVSFVSCDSAGILVIRLEFLVIRLGLEPRTLSLEG